MFFSDEVPIRMLIDKKTKTKTPPMGKIKYFFFVFHIMPSKIITKRSLGNSKNLQRLQKFNLSCFYLAAANTKDK
jgi:hypothetical protein